MPILAKWAPPPCPVQITHAMRRQQPLKFRAFLDFVAQRLQKTLRVIKENCSSTEIIGYDQLSLLLIERRIIMDS